MLLCSLPLRAAAHKRLRSSRMNLTGAVKLADDRYVWPGKICKSDKDENQTPHSYHVNRQSNLLKASKALWGADGIVHFGVALWVGQNPVVNTLTLKSTPCRLVYKKEKKYYMYYPPCIQRKE